jgi:hypothetical protein
MFSDNFIYSNIKSNRIFRLYNQVGNKQFQKINIAHARNAPYTFFSTNPVPDEPFVNRE